MSWRTTSPTGAPLPSPAPTRRSKILDQQPHPLRACRLLTRCLDLYWVVDSSCVGKRVEVLQARESLADRCDRVAGGGEDLADVPDPPVDRHRCDREECRDGDLRQACPVVQDRGEQPVAQGEC